MFRQCTLITVVLLGLTQLAWAKPRSSQADTVLENCQWAALVEIVSVKPAPGKGWRPTIVVHVSSKADDVFRGAKAGADIAVHPLPSSDDATSADLLQLVDTKERILMVVNDEDQVEFVGTPSKHKEGRRFRLRSWYDFNAWWIYSTDKKFGTPIKPSGGPMQTLELREQEIRARLK